MTNTLTLTSPINLTPTAEKTIGALLLVPAIISIMNVAIAFQPVQATETPTTDEQLLINLTNQERNKYGLASLMFNPTLELAAEAKAADMLKNGYFEHVSPTGKTPWVFITDAGYDYVKAGENLAIDFPTVEGPVPAWMASPGHRANILKKDYREIGIAEVKGTFQGRETTLVVQMFGTRQFDMKAMASSLVNAVTIP